MSGPGRARAYGAAVLAAAGATLFALVTRGPGHAGVFLPFVLAVTFSAWYGGQPAGFLATLLSSAALAWLFAADVPSVGVATIDLLLVLAFVGTGGAIALLVGGLERKRAEEDTVHLLQRAQAARADAEAAERRATLPAEASRVFASS